MIPLSADALNDDALPWRVRVFDELGSTSDWLKQNAAQLEIGTVVSPSPKPPAEVVATTAGSRRAARI